MSVGIIYVNMNIFASVGIFLGQQEYFRVCMNIFASLGIFSRQQENLHVRRNIFASAGMFLQVHQPDYANQGTT